MDIIIEVIDGVAYAVVRGECEDCVFTPPKSEACGCELPYHKCYRRLTAEEREKLHEAIGRGAKMNNKIDLTKVSAVCDYCAKAAGCKPKNKICGVWFGTCDICKERKPCTNLWHDWIVPKEEYVK